MLAQQAARLLDSPEPWCDGTPTASKLAARLGTSERHTRRLFEAHWGVSPLQYLQTRRLLRAKQWLTDTDLPIADVARLSGFASLPTEHMHILGRQYGMGLQRLNILRDSKEDLAGGRCYWPRETLSASGLTPEMLAQATQTGSEDTLRQLAPLFTAWLDQTHTQLTAGMRYAMALKPLRLRLASALPALIGAQTLAMLRQKGPGAMTEHIKVSRRDLRRLFWQLALGWGTPATLGQLFVKLSGRVVA
jgi:AraC-like DNA-binding protein